MNVRKNEHGFFTMIICLTLIIIAVIAFAYTRVHSKQDSKTGTAPISDQIARCEDPSVPC